MSQNFGIKPFYPKIEGMCLRQNLREGTRELTGFQRYADQGVDGVKVDICWIDSFRMTSADDDDGV